MFDVSNRAHGDAGHKGTVRPLPPRRRPGWEPALGSDRAWHSPASHLAATGNRSGAVVRTSRLMHCRGPISPLRTPPVPTSLMPGDPHAQVLSPDLPPLPDGPVGRDCVDRTGRGPGRVLAGVTGIQGNRLRAPRDRAARSARPGAAGCLASRGSRAVAEFGVRRQPASGASPRAPVRRGVQAGFGARRALHREPRSPARRTRGPGLPPRLSHHRARSAGLVPVGPRASGSALTAPTERT